MENLFRKEIMALIPDYIDLKGNCTLVYVRDSDPIVLDKSIRTVLRLIGKHFMIDLAEVKKKYRALMSTHNLMPIPLSKEDIFIPFKTRTPMYKNDGAFGYINMRYIKSVKKNGNSTIVVLDDNSSIKCLSRISTVENHMRNGNIVSRCYEDRSIMMRESQGLYESLIPATKADIAMIQKQLSEFATK